MIESIQVVRDVVIILSFIIITGMVVIVCVALRQLARKIENVRSVAAAAVTGMVSPVKVVRRVLLTLSRRTAR